MLETNKQNKKTTTKQTNQKPSPLHHSVHRLLHISDAQLLESESCLWPSRYKVQFASPPRQDVSLQATEAPVTSPGTATGKHQRHHKALSIPGTPWKGPGQPALCSLQRALGLFPSLGRVCLSQ